MEHAHTPSASLRFIAVRCYDSQLLIIAPDKQKLSATIPNIEDIGEWLNAPKQGVKVFGDEFRPVRIDIKVVGFKNGAKNAFMFENNLNFKLLNIVIENNGGKPTLVV